MTTPFGEEKAPGLNSTSRARLRVSKVETERCGKKKRPHLRRVIAKSSVSVRLSRLLGESDDSDD
jgi:hypothetical protein